MYKILSFRWFQKYIIIIIQVPDALTAYIFHRRERIARRLVSCTVTHISTTYCNNYKQEGVGKPMYLYGLDICSCILKNNQIIDKKISVNRHIYPMSYNYINYKVYFRLLIVYNIIKMTTNIFVSVSSPNLTIGGTVFSVVYQSLCNSNLTKIVIIIIKGK